MEAVLPYVTLPWELHISISTMFTSLCRFQGRALDLALHGRNNKVTLLKELVDQEVLSQPVWERGPAVILQANFPICAACVCLCRRAMVANRFRKSS